MNQQRSSEGQPQLPKIAKSGGSSEQKFSFGKDPYSLSMHGISSNGMPSSTTKIESAVDIRKA